MANKHNEDCPKMPVECDFRPLGCTTSLLQEEYVTHQVVAAAEHARLALVRIAAAEAQAKVVFRFENEGDSKVCGVCNRHRPAKRRRLTVTLAEVGAAADISDFNAALVRFVWDADMEAKVKTAAALEKLAINIDNMVAIARAGAIEPLAKLLLEGNAKGKANAAIALWNLTGNADSQVAIARAGAIEPLVKIRQQGNAKEKVRAADALWCLAVNTDNAAAIRRLGYTHQQLHKPLR